MPQNPLTNQRALLWARISAIAYQLAFGGYGSQCLIVLFFDIERFAHYFDGEFFKPMRGFGVGTLSRERHATMRGRSQEMHDFNH